VKVAESVVKSVRELSRSAPSSTRELDCSKRAPAEISTGDRPVGEAAEPLP